MGGRGSFINVDTNDFRFVENGKTFSKVGEIDNIHILVRDKKYSVKAPEYSHTENRIYAIIQDGKIKHISFYDENHKQVRVIDFGHEHGFNHVKPHVHENMQHIKNEGGTPPSKSDLEIIEKVNKWMRSR